MPRDGDGKRHCQLKINILTFKKSKNNLILSAIIWNTYQATIPPLDGHIIAQSLVEDPLWAKALRTLLPAIFSVSVLWQDSVYQVVLLSKWTLAISLCLGKTNLQNITDQYSQPHTRSIITATPLVQSLSSTLPYFSFFPPSQSISYCPVTQIWRPGDPRPAPEDHMSSWAIWRGNALLTHMLSLTPPSAHTLPPADCVEGLKQSWQGHTVWFCCQFKLCPSFYI